MSHKPYVIFFVFAVDQAEETLGIIQVRLFDRGMAAKGTLLRNNKVRHLLPCYCALVATCLNFGVD